MAHSSEKSSGGNTVGDLPFVLDGNFESELTDAIGGIARCMKKLRRIDRWTAPHTVAVRQQTQLQLERGRKALVVAARRCARDARLRQARSWDAIFAVRHAASEALSLHRATRYDSVYVLAELTSALVVELTWPRLLHDDEHRHSNKPDPSPANSSGEQEEGRQVTRERNQPTLPPSQHQT